MPTTRTKKCKILLRLHVEVVMYVDHEVLAPMTGKKNQSREHLGSEARRSRLVVSCIDCTVGLLHRICGEGSDPHLHHAQLYHRRSLELIYMKYHV